MRTRHLLGCALAITACACGNDKTAPSPTVTTIVITSLSDLLFIGTSETFTATATFSDGTTRAITNGVWGTNESQIVNVEPATGRVLAVGSGNATVFVDFEGSRGTRAIRGLPDYQGAWSGSYIVRSCMDTGEIVEVEVCSDLFAPEAELPLGLIATQTRDAATGELLLGSFSGPVNGPIQLNGQWLVTGTVRIGELSIETVWTLQSAQSGRITGSGNLILRVESLGGDVRIAVEILDLTRVSMTASAPSAGRDRRVRTIRDVKAALRGRR